MNYVEETMFDVQIDETILIRQTFESISDSDMTMYQIAKILNVILEKLNVQKNGIDYRVRPQMIYNYNRNKMIVKGRVADLATKVEAYEFIVRFVKRVNK